MAIHNGDNHEALLYFAEDEVGAVDTAGTYPASTFLGMELVDADSVMLTFRTATNAAKMANITMDFSGNFKDACRAIAGALNSNTMTVVADEANGVYLNYPGGSFNGVVAMDDETA